MVLKAYAKVNLILKVNNKLDSGYHNLQMINAFIDLYDEIDITEYDQDIVEYKNVDIDKSEDIVIKGLTLLKKLYNIEKCYKIKITKNIPVASGMAGGSSDVAAVIKYLCSLYNIKIDDKLINAIKEIGTDIIYMLYDGVRYVEGIGDIVDNKTIDIKEEFVIVNPNIKVKTPDVFKNNKKYSSYINKEELIEKVKNKEYENDLEESSFNLDNRLYILKEKLSKVGKTIMSGSGSTMMVFGNDIDYIYNECLKINKSYFIRKVKIIGK